MKKTISIGLRKTSGKFLNDSSSDQEKQLPNFSQDASFQEDLKNKKRKKVKQIFENIFKKSQGPDGPFDFPLAIAGAEKFLNENKNFHSMKLDSQIKAIKSFFLKENIIFEYTTPQDKKDVPVAETRPMQSFQKDGKSIVGVLGEPGQPLSALEDALINAFALMEIMNFESKK